MQFEFFDKKVREAAERHYPAYDEQAWQGMRRLLDRHMPEERKRRPGFFWILLAVFLLTGGGAYWYFLEDSGRQLKQGSGVSVQPAETERGSRIQQPDPSHAGLPVREGSTDNSRPEINAFSPQNNGSVINPAAKFPKGYTGLPVVVREQAAEKKVAETTGSRKQDPAVAVMTDIPGTLHPSKGLRELPQNPADRTSGKELSLVNKDGNPDDSGKETAAPEAQIAGQGLPTQKRKLRSSFLGRFQFFLAGGPDISYTRMDNGGEWRIARGGGVSFDLSKRLLFRAGLFSSHKVYSARPSDYHPPALFWNYYPNMQSIDADCRVFELPLLLSYRLGKSDRNAFLATAGISSLWMKEEKYTYYYKPYPNGPVYQRNYAYTNQNKHPFSVLTFSAAYQRKFGRHLSLTAEPYIKLPLQGVGFGKVKLNGGGLMISLGLRPFARQPVP